MQHSDDTITEMCRPGGVFTSSLTGRTTDLNYTSSLRAEDVSLSLSGTTVECEDGPSREVIGSTTVCIAGRIYLDIIHVSNLFSV